MSAARLPPVQHSLRSVSTLRRLQRATTSSSGARHARLNSSVAVQASKDQSHPNLYYHPFPDPQPGRIAISFLPDRPRDGSRTIMGYLPMKGGDLSDFKENYDFTCVLSTQRVNGFTVSLENRQR